MQKVSIIRTSHQSELGPGGQPRTLVRVDFRVGDDGPFSISIPDADFTADELHRRVLAIAEQVSAARDKFTT